MADENVATEPALSDSQKHAEELEALYRISQVLTMGTTEQSTLAEVLDILHAELGMRSGTIMLVTPDRSEVQVEVAHNLTARQRRAVRYDVGEGITGRVVETGKPAIVPKVSEEPMFLDRLRKRRAIEKGEISFICVPISVGNEVVGALSVDRVFDETAPLDEDVRLLSIVASMVALDIHSRRQWAAQREAYEAENLKLRSQLEDAYRPENIIGTSDAMQQVYAAIQQVAASDATVLIRGESGTGKELVAHAIHYSSPRARNPFVKVNCAALSENLLESELFGHEKGAFTGAIQAREGRIEQADGGTLLLDEIGDFTPQTQVKLLRFLQEREFERVGSNKVRKANVRILAATNRDLEQAAESGQFRQDLYYRVNVFPIHLPPLRDRRGDILLLADAFVERHAKKLGKDVRRITTPAINMMLAYHWPGNVRELENCIERAVLLTTDGVIHGHHLPPSLQTSDASDTIGEGTLQARVDLFERDIIVDALKRTGGNITASAKELGSTPRIIRYKIDNLGIDWKRYRRSAKRSKG